jgi:hypothetical protein
LGSTANDARKSFGFEKALKGAVEGTDRARGCDAAGRFQAREVVRRGNAVRVCARSRPACRHKPPTLPREAVRRSTLSDANEARDWRI